MEVVKIRSIKTMKNSLADHVTTAQVRLLIASQAKQSRDSANLDWIASSLALLALTAGEKAYAWLATCLPIAACAAANRAIGTR